MSQRDSVSRILCRRGNQQTLLIPRLSKSRSQCDTSAFGGLCIERRETQDDIDRLDFGEDCSPSLSLYSCSPYAVLAKKPRRQYYQGRRISSAYRISRFECLVLEFLPDLGFGQNQDIGIFCFDVKFEALEARRCQLEPESLIVLSDLLCAGNYTADCFDMEAISILPLPSKEAKSSPFQQLSLVIPAFFASKLTSIGKVVFTGMLESRGLTGSLGAFFDFFAAEGLLSSSSSSLASCPFFCLLMEAGGAV